MIAGAGAMNSLLPRGAGGSVRIPPSAISVMYSYLPIVVLSFGFWDQYSDYLQSQSLASYSGNYVESYDFIIVGAGSAGSVLANRLSMNPNYQVLLLENGGSPNPMQIVPSYFGALVHIPQIDYDYYTVPQKNACLAMNGQRSSWPRGKGLGGSSNLNGMIYQRGHPSDFDQWAKLSGSDEWKFVNVLRSFKNIEDYHGQYYDEKWHSQNGQGVYVSVSSEEHLYPEFLEAGKEMGYPTTRDVNGRQEASFSRMDVNVKNGRRFGAYPAFIEPILYRKNLKIYRYAHVTKIELDESNRAIGVTYIRHGVQRFVKADKEVIVSAGAVDSPKLLMLSGIGPKKGLERLGIKSRVNLPVGLNLQDHVMTTFGPFTLETRGWSINLRRDVTLSMISNYFTNRKGTMSSPGMSGVAYVHSSLAKGRMKLENLTASEVSPDIQLVLYPAAPTASLSQVVENGANVKKGSLKPYFQASENKDGFFFNVMVGKYYSRGEIMLASKDPLDNPVINPRYLTHPNDIRILKEGMEFALRLVESTKAFQKLGAQLSKGPLPGCERFKLKSIQYLECYARKMTISGYHPCATCTMGRGKEDPKAVVDSTLRVLKTKGLRVVDASIIPEIPNANINSIVYMIADKASEMILEYWRKNPQERLESFERTL